MDDRSPRSVRTEPSDVDGEGVAPGPAGRQRQGGQPAPVPEPELPATIVAERGGFIPERVDYDAMHERFLTGSLTEGTILEIQADGTVTAVVTDPDLVSSIGIEVDEERDRLLVANSDRSVFDGSTAGQAKLGVYNLTTGERIAMVDLAASIADRPADAAHFANDAAVGDDGTAYVTDTRMDVIYRVGTDYKASVLHRFDSAEGLGLNGIVHHPSDYLLVAAGATLFKVPVDDPSAASKVMLPEEIPGQDGLVWTADGRLAIVSNSGNRVLALTSAADWTTAQLAGVAIYDTQPTTAAVVGDDVYVVHPHFADADPPSLERMVFH
jgi:sugar lactone lactonase YvrE